MKLKSKNAAVVLTYYYSQLLWTNEAKQLVKLNNEFWKWHDKLSLQYFCTSESALDTTKIASFGDFLVTLSPL